MPQLKWVSSRSLSLPWLVHGRLHIAHGKGREAREVKQQGPWAPFLSTHLSLRCMKTTGDESGSGGKIWYGVRTGTRNFRYSRTSHIKATTQNAKPWSSFTRAWTILGQNFASLAYGDCRDLTHVLNFQKISGASCWEISISSFRFIAVSVKWRLTRGSKQSKIFNF